MFFVHCITTIELTDLSVVFCGFSLTFSLSISKSTSTKLFVISVNYGMFFYIMGKVFEIRICVEMLVNDIKIYTVDQFMFY